MNATSPLPITHALDHVSGGARISILGTAGVLEQATLSDLAGAATGVAERLRRDGFEEGAPLAVALPTSLDAVVAMLAAWTMGSPICLLPLRRGGSPTHARLLQDSLALIRPGALLVSELVASGLDGVQRRVPLERTFPRGALANTEACHAFRHPKSDDLAILQLTSGSTGQPKAVPVAHRHLAANVAGIVERAEIESRDVIVSWMPLFHDMGLSMVTQSIAAGCSLQLLDPATFSASPTTWLRAIDSSQGTVAPTTPSALRLLRRMHARAVRSGTVLQSLRTVWVGGEPIFAADLDGFEEVFEGCGLGKTVLQPAYGLAESVVAVSVGPSGRPRRYATLDVVRLQSSVVNPVLEMGARPVSLVANGKPLRGLDVTIRAKNGATLEQGVIGEINVSGTSVPGHYFGDERRNETVPTGDLGFLLDGEVFVTGRTKDLIVRGGKKIAAHDVERCVEDLGDLGPGSAIAFSCIDFTRSRERLVILLDERAQRTLGKDPDVIMDRVSRGIGLAVDVLEFVPATALPRTTSGKLRREEARRAYVDASRLKEEHHGRP